MPESQATARDTIVLQMTEGQRDRIAQSTGLFVPRIEAARAGFVAMVLAADAVKGGAKLGMRSPMLVELTSEQRKQLADAGVESSELVFDPDGSAVTYHEEWSQDFPPFPLGRRLCVIRHEDRREPLPDRLAIRLMADSGSRGPFGTGLHPTTRVAARLLEDWIREGDLVADVGSGSGVLAIAAIRLGARHVLGLEIDESAVDLAKQNLSINGIDGQVDMVNRELDGDDGPFDLVIANIFPNIVVQLAPLFRRVVRPGGLLIIGGMVDDRIAEISGVIEGEGFESLVRRSRLGWSGEVLRAQRPMTTSCEMWPDGER